MTTDCSNSPIHAVLFDLDGTLLDTAPDMAAALNQLCEHHSLPTLDYQRVRTTVSHGARALITLAFDISEDNERFEPLRQEFLQLYSRQLVRHTAPFDGIDTLLLQLEQRQIPWGIVTNKPRAYTIPILQTLKLNHRCQAVVCPDDVSRTKPDPEPLFKACDQIECEPGNTVYIGDHQRDIEAGKRAGMLTIATAYGYIPSTDNIEDWQADYCVDHAEQIFTLLMPRIAGQ